MIVPTPGSTAEKRAVENCKTVELTVEELEELQDTGMKFAAVGARYPSH